MGKNHSNGLMLGDRHSGLTLIELVVALSIAAIVISLVMFSWTFLASHTMHQKHKSAFYSQAEQTASIITTDIRTSPHVLYFDKNSITFIAGSGGDTVTYRLGNDSLRKNGIGLHFVTEGSKVTQFSVEKDAASSPASAGQPLTQNNEQRDIVLIVTLGMLDRTGISSVIKNKVKISYAEDQDIAIKNKWNY